jgi:anti-anti-sigma factor
MGPTNGNHESERKRKTMDALQNQPIVIAIPSTIYREILERVVERFAGQVTADDADYVLDLKDVANVYSTTFNLIVSLYKQIAAKRGRVSIVNASAHVRRALENLNLHSLMPIYDSMIMYDLIHEAAMAA